MALFINESTSSLADFVGKLYSFATNPGGGNPGWTGDRDPVANPGEFAISKAAVQTNTNDIQVAMGWDTGTPSNIGIYQYDHASGAGNYVPANNPWGQDNDSGNGFAGTTNANLDDERYAAIGNTPVQYWAFAGNSPYAYLHVVVQTDSTTYVHLGWGELAKFNDWQGGAYCYGHRFNAGTNNNQTIQTGSTHLLDGRCQDGSFPNPTNAMELYMATINCENLPQQPAGGKWAVIGGNQSDLGQDRQAVPVDRALFAGGYRANEWARNFGGFGINRSNGFVPAYPIGLLYWNRSPSTIYGPMGIMPDVYGVNIDQFAAGDEILVGADTWVVFPSRRKGSSGSEVGSSKYQGMMYKKN